MAGAGNVDVRRSWRPHCVDDGGKLLPIVAVAVQQPVEVGQRGAGGEPTARQRAKLCPQMAHSPGGHKVVTSDITYYHCHLATL
jgi:hypothetical protein